MSEKNITGAAGQDGAGAAGHGGAGAAGQPAGQNLNEAANTPQLPEITLSDGRKAWCERARAAICARPCVGRKNDTAMLQFELAAVLTTIDGKPVFSDDLLEMDMDDALELMGAVGGASFFPKTDTSST